MAEFHRCDKCGTEGEVIVVDVSFGRIEVYGYFKEHLL